MLKNKQLSSILKSLENSIENLEDYLYRYNDNLSSKEKTNIMKQIQEYKNTSLEIEYMIENNQSNQFSAGINTELSNY